MVFRALYHGSEVSDTHTAVVLAIDNLVESGYSIEDCERMGYKLPDVPELPLILAGIKRGKERYHRRIQRDAEARARMRS